MGAVGHSGTRASEAVRTPPLTKTNVRTIFARMKKGERTRASIVGEAVALASQVGLEGLSIGALADRLEISKSGLFAHFGSKEELQLAALRAAQEEFVDAVFRPAMQRPRGLARLRAIFANWLDWALHGPQPGGCVILAASSEYDDRPGPIRDLLAAGQREWRAAIIKAVKLAIDAGELHADTDPAQVAFEIMALVLAVHHDRRLLDDRRAASRATRAFDRLLADYAEPRQ